MNTIKNIYVDFASLFNNIDILILDRFIDINRDSVDSDRISILSDEMIISRHHPNPLKLITNFSHEDDDKLEIIRNKIYDNNIDFIISHLRVNEKVLSFLNNLHDMECITVTVKVNNNHEYEYISNNFKNFTATYEFRDTYDSYMFSEFDYSFIDKLSNKKIYFINYNFNDILTKIYLKLKDSNNDISLFEAFIFELKG